MQFEKESAGNNIGYTSKYLWIQVLSARTWSPQLQGNCLGNYLLLAQDLDIIKAVHAQKVGSTIVSQDSDSNDGNCCSPTTSTHNGPMVCGGQSHSGVWGKRGNARHPEHTKDCATDESKKNSNPEGIRGKPNGKARNATHQCEERGYLYSPIMIAKSTNKRASDSCTQIQKRYSIGRLGAR